jgi:hypothetical protein
VLRSGLNHCGQKDEPVFELLLKLLEVYKTELYVVPALYLLINRQDGGHGMLASLQATILASDAWNMGCGWREGGREVGRGSI